MRAAISRLAGSLLVILFGFTCVRAQPINLLTNSIIRITGQSCAHEPRIGTGFFYQNTRQIVTALHVVAGCQISLQLDKQYATADIKGVLKEADLALLTPRTPLSGTPFQLSAGAPRVDDHLRAFGYALGAPSWTDEDFRLAFNSSTLRNMLPEVVSSSLDQAKSPDPSIAILRLNGPLFGGLSGAPVLNEGGQLVGIGDGGLRHGIVAISWAIDAHEYLGRLLQSNEPATNAFVTLNDNLSSFSPDDNLSSFSPDEEKGWNQHQQCGGLNFYKRGDRRLGDLIADADNKEAAAQIMASYGTNSMEAHDLMYSIWSQPDSGASIAIPEGDALESDSSRCTVYDDRTHFKVLLAGYKVYSDADAQSHRQTIEFLWRRNNQVDSPFGDGEPHRLNNDPTSSILRRVVKDASGFHVGAETIMVRGSYWIGAALTSEILDDESVERCLKNAQGRFCEHILEVASAEEKLLLGLRVSTLPPI